MCKGIDLIPLLFLQQPCKVGQYYCHYASVVELRLREGDFISRGEVQTTDFSFHNLLIINATIVVEALKGHSLVVEHVLCTQKALGLVPSISC